ISHEVTNAVAATNSLLESCLKYAELIDGGEHRADYENALNVLIKRNRSLNEFTQAFSELVKLPPPQRGDVDVAELLAAMRVMFRPELERRGIGLDVHVEPGLPQVSMDRSQIDQVMINVVKNAIEAIDGRGRIELRAEQAGPFVEVSVIDDGVGLSDESKESLFTPFYTTKREGQGVGLMLVKEILTQHGFVFTLETADRKTRFMMRMPTSMAAC